MMGWQPDMQAFDMVQQVNQRRIELGLHPEGGCAIELHHRLTFILSKGFSIFVSDWAAARTIASRKAGLFVPPNLNVFYWLLIVHKYINCNTNKTGDKDI